MRIYVELPDGWGPSRVIVTAWERAGYRRKPDASEAPSVTEDGARGTSSPSQTITPTAN